MREYIVPIADNERDYDEMFIGTIRKREELVRCGECMYRDKGEYEYCPMLKRKTFEGFYCAYGERRADDET